MDRDFFLNAGLQFDQSPQQPWKLMTLLPEMNFPIADGISKPNWEKSDQLSHFESALSSMVSSPVSNSTVSTDIVAVRELIGKLGSGSPAAMNTAAPYSSATNSPLNSSSPPKLNLPIMDQFVKESFPRIQNSMPMNPNLPLLSTDPGFAERAAKFSCFGSRSFNGRMNQSGLNSNPPDFQFGSNGSPMNGVKFPRVSSSPSLKIDRSTVGFDENKNSEEPNLKLSRLSGSAANSNEESSVSHQIPSSELGIKNQKDLNSKKRKGSSSKGIGSINKKEEEAIDDSNSKKMKKGDHENGGKKEENTKPVEAPKDYIHVRARRGQATDSHSLAERVRREKISERMKLLQNLVPNCNKITGKALMLDEIINYVQSLQRQVEFLSMKLATVNPSLDYATDNLLSPNLNQSHPVESSASPFFQQNAQALFNESAPMNQSVQEFIEPFPQFPGFGHDDLQSIVQMGFGEDVNVDIDTPFFQAAPDQPCNMKMEF